LRPAGDPERFDVDEAGRVVGQASTQGVDHAMQRRDVLFRLYDPI
jgi:hypothetical protein